MKWLFQPLLLLLARSTDSDLARMVEFLKAENAMLRRRINKRIRLKAEEKRLLVKLGEAVGSGVGVLLTIVSYPTYRRYLNQVGSPDPDLKKNAPKRKPGRPPTPQHVRELVLKLARENDWGYTRILGELKKLRIKTSRSNVVNILRQNELDPKTDPGKGTWGEFLKAHAETLWQCDFFSKHIVTPEGVRQCFILAFIHVATRRVFLSPCTFKPDAAWMEAQAHAFLQHAEGQNLPAEVMLRDRDSKYTVAFEGPLKAAGMKVKVVGRRAPNMNAYIERFVQAIQRECLDKFIAFGRGHLDHLVAEYVAHYHAERPHQGKGNRPLIDTGESPPAEVEVVCHERLGGVLRHYYRSAA